MQFHYYKQIWDYFQIIRSKFKIVRYFTATKLYVPVGTFVLTACIFLLKELHSIPMLIDDCMSEQLIYNQSEDSVLRAITKYFTLLTTR